MTVTELVTGTAYWFDLSLSTTNSTGAASISSISMTITELA